jgi:hypothetical protein
MLSAAFGNVSVVKTGWHGLTWAQPAPASAAPLIDAASVST